jgi:hypothetical protein
MLLIGRKPVINYEMSKYIREKTNKFANKQMEKYSNSDSDKDNLVIIQNKFVSNGLYTNLNIFPFIIFSFIVGYNFCYYTNK